MNLWIRWNQSMNVWMRGPQDLILLALRLWIAWIFFKSGWLKLQSWEVTLELFAYEYAVPLLPTEMAAIMATVGELLLPPFLVLGFLCRPTALALFVLNLVAAVSYPDLSPAGLKDHQLWGLALTWLLLQGAGRLSLDGWLSYRHHEAAMTLSYQRDRSIE